MKFANKHGHIYISSKKVCKIVKCSKSFLITGELIISE